MVSNLFLAILEPQLSATGVAYKKLCTAVTVMEIMHFFMSTNPVRTKRLRWVANKSKFKVWGQKITLTIIYISFEK